MDAKTERFLKKAAEVSGETLSNAVWGYARAGVVGGAFAVGGTLSKEAAKQVFSKHIVPVVSDIAGRELSARQEIRASRCAVHAMNRIFERLLRDESPRDDIFFTPGLTGECSEAQSLLEAVVLKAQNEYEERKIPFIGNIFSNAVFSRWSYEAINRIVKTAEAMSYRQICILGLMDKVSRITIKQPHNPDPRDIYEKKLRALAEIAQSIKTHALASSPTREYMAVDAEIWDMAGRLHVLIDVFESYSRCYPEMSYFGDDCVKFMSLDELPESDVNQRPKTRLEPSRVVLYPFAQHSVRHGDPLEHHGGRYDAPPLASRHRLQILGT